MSEIPEAVWVLHPESPDSSWDESSECCPDCETEAVKYIRADIAEKREAELKAQMVRAIEFLAACRKADHA